MHRNALLCVRNLAGHSRRAQFLRTSGVAIRGDCAMEYCSGSPQSSMGSRVVADPDSSALANPRRVDTHHRASARDYRMGLSADGGRLSFSRDSLDRTGGLCRLRERTRRLPESLWRFRHSSVGSGERDSPALCAPPTGWQAVNTEFGAVAHSTLTPDDEYKIAQTIQRTALSARASVIVFPETVVPYWTAATDQFWQPTIDALRSERKTILLGALVPRSDRDQPEQTDFSAELAALKSGVVPLSLDKQQDRRRPDSGASYFNAIIARGADLTSFRQRIPVPIAMWNPFSAHGAPISLLGPGILKVHHERVAVLICYEQLLVWPVLASMTQHPTVIVAIANDHWATGTTIPRFQLSAVRAWSRLFGVPYLSAVNF